MAGLRNDPHAHDPLAPFRLRDYRLVSAGILLSALIERSQAVAIGWDLYERTGSALALGTIGLVQFLPVILLFLPAGHLADVFDRRWVVLLSFAAWGAANVILVVVVAAALVAGFPRLAWLAFAGALATAAMPGAAEGLLSTQLLPWVAATTAV